MTFGRKQTSTGARWIESLIITAAAPILGSLVNPDDPYLLKGAFPWLLLAPLAVGLQHGLWAGLFSSALLCAGALWQSLSTGTIPPEFSSWCIGCGLVALVAGQVRDSVRARSEQLRQRADELQDRLERSERTRHVIQLSHAKLAERVASGRSSLVAAIESAAQRMAETRSMHELGRVLLEVVANQGNLHAASLYIAGRDITQLVETPVASFGGNGESSAANPLVRRAFTTGKLAAIVDGPEATSTDKSVLAAVPLITSQRQIVGVVAVHQLPFMAFHAEHLNQMFVLAGHLADMLFDRWTQVHASPHALPEVSSVIETLRAHRWTDPVTYVPVPVPVHVHENTRTPILDIEVEVDVEVDVDVDVDAAEPAEPPIRDDEDPIVEVESAEAIDPEESPKAPAITLPPERRAVARIAVEQEAAAAPVVEDATTASAEDARCEAIADAVETAIGHGQAADPADVDSAAESTDEEAVSENPIMRALRRAKGIAAPLAPKRAAAKPAPAEREDVTQTRAVVRDTQARARHVTREFHALFKFPKPIQTPSVAAPVTRPRVRAQAEIRAQVAEAAARRSGSL